MTGPLWRKPKQPRRKIKLLLSAGMQNETMKKPETKNFIVKLKNALENQRPYLDQCSQKEVFPWEAVKALIPLGAWGMIYPKEYNGLGLSHYEYVQALEEFGRVDPSLALTAESHNSLCGHTILQFGSEELRAKYLPLLAKGTMGAWALTEAEAGSDAKSIRTTAQLKDNHWILNGSKTFTTQGSVAGVYVIFAVTALPNGEKGISAFAAEPGPGIEIGKKEIKMGLRASDTAQLYLNNLKLPQENLIGAPNQGFSIAMKILDAGRVAISGVALGVTRGALEWTINKIKNKKQETRSLRTRWAGKDNPGLKAEQKIIAHLTARLHAARLVALHAARLFDQKKRYAFYGCLAKLLSGELAMQATTQLLDLIGEEGGRIDCHAAKLFRDSKLYEIGEGTSEVQALVISRYLFSNPELLLKPPNLYDFNEVGGNK
ncbi:MAG: acyl-CoA dehydrogenase family protein [Elusimicrobia bacterium]|nr:acyl-CoA dehydrogenase family protein [Elusimicrobiota bacterium]